MVSGLDKEGLPDKGFLPAAEQRVAGDNGKRKSEPCPETDSQTAAHSSRQYPKIIHPLARGTFPGRRSSPDQSMLLWPDLLFSGDTRATVSSSNSPSPYSRLRNHSPAR